MRTPLAVMTVLFFVLLGIGLVSESDERQPPPAAPVDVIARRVEQLRGLHFKALPKPVEVTAAQARREGLEDLDRAYPPNQRHADETVYKLLGLIDADADLRDVAGSLFEQGVAGYYDTRDGRLRVVTGAGTGNRVVAEMTLAHELTHALEDQQFDFHEPTSTDDPALARTALIEGTATWMMEAYVERHFSREEALGSLLGEAFQGTGDLPPFVQAQVLFPYVGGEAFVSDLLRRAGGRWDLVNTAFRLRVPSSTEQIMHPQAYFKADEPAHVRLRARAALGPGWHRTAAGTWGEMQTRELLSFAGGNSAAAAQGWGGDRYELWESTGRGVLLMRWRWDTPRDRAEFVPALREWAASKLDGPHAVVTRGGAVTLVVAPDRRTVNRLAARA
jgi:hypothetical protein